MDKLLYQLFAKNTPEICGLYFQLALTILNNCYFSVNSLKKKSEELVLRAEKMNAENVHFYMAVQRYYTNRSSTNHF